MSDPFRPMVPGEPVDGDSPIFSTRRGNALTRLVDPARRSAVPSAGEVLGSGGSGGGGATGCTPTIEFDNRGGLAFRVVHEDCTQPWQSVGAVECSEALVTRPATDPT